MADIGVLFMGLALAAAILSILAFVLGRWRGPRDGEALTNIGYFATFGVFASTTAAVAILTSAFIREDFTLEYVAQHHSTNATALEWLYKVAAVWAGREGSLLFWAWLITMFAAWVAYRRMSIADELSNMSLAVLNFVQVFFFTALFIPLNNPFKLSPAHWVGPGGELLVSGKGMNPLLEHWAMTLHPPTLFIGYAGLAVPFAFAIGALIVNNPSKLWVEIVDRITVFAWLMLGLGNGIGALWAYVVLDWGGYWAWDPVENASLLAWLTGVGLLHSFTVYKRRGGFKKWAIMMAVFSFVFVLLGTFITRSGIVQSVHSFAVDELSFWWFLSMMAGSVLAGLVGITIRSESFKGADDFESLTSKEASYYFNNVLMLISAIVVATLTIAPALSGTTYGPATFDSIARPVGVLYVFIMAVCPLLAWRNTEGSAFLMKIRWPLVAAALMFTALSYLWWTAMWPNHLFGNPEANPATSIVHTYLALAGLAVGSLAITVAVYLFIIGAQKRAKAKGEGFLKALGWIIFRARTQSGGYIAHLGMGIILIGLVGSSMFVKDVRVVIPDQPGHEFQVGGFDFRFKGYEEETRPNGDHATRLVFDVFKNGEPRGELTPGRLKFARQGQEKSEASVIVEPLQDIFVIYEPSTQPWRYSLNIKVNPLISWVWVGFGLLSVGTAIAMWPRRRPEPVA